MSGMEETMRGGSTERAQEGEAAANGGGDLSLQLPAPERSVRQPSGDWTQRAKELFADPSAMAREMFNMLNINNDGRLTREEMAEQMKTLDPGYSMDKVDYIFQTLDPENIGYIDFPKFEQNFRFIVDPHGDSTSFMATLFENSMSVNNSVLSPTAQGSRSPRPWGTPNANASFAAEYGLDDSTLATFYQWFDEADTDHQGSLNKVQFAKLVSDHLAPLVSPLVEDDSLEDRIAQVWEQHQHELNPEGRLEFANLISAFAQLQKTGDVYLSSPQKAELLVPPAAGHRRSSSASLFTQQVAAGFAAQPIQKTPQKKRGLPRQKTPRTPNTYGQHPDAEGQLPIGYGPSPLVNDPKSETFTSPSRTAAEQLYSWVDRDGDGRITIEDLAQPVLFYTGHQVTEEESLQLREIMEVRGISSISCDEFGQMLQHYKAESEDTRSLIKSFQAAVNIDSHQLGDYLLQMRLERELLQKRLTDTTKARMTDEVRMHDLRRQLSKAEEENDNLTGRVRELEVSLSKQKDQLRDLQTQLAAQNAKSADLQTELAEVTTKLNQATENVKRQEQELTRRSEDLQSLQKEKEAITEELNQLESEKEALLKEQQRESQEVAALATRTPLKKRGTQSFVDVQQVEEQLNRLDEAEIEITQLRQSDEENRRMLDDLQQHLQQLEAENRALKDDLHNVETSAANAQAVAAAAEVAAAAAVAKAQQDAEAAAQAAAEAQARAERQAKATADAQAQLEAQTKALEDKPVHRTRVYEADVEAKAAADVSVEPKAAAAAPAEAAPAHRKTARAPREKQQMSDADMVLHADSVEMEDMHTAVANAGDSSGDDTPSNQQMGTTKKKDYPPENQGGCNALCAACKIQ